MTDSNATELLCCPFCGGKPLVDRIDEGADYNPWYWWTVHCSNRDCVCSDLCHEYPTEAEAVESWNTRAERTTTRNGKPKTKYGRKVPLCECCGYAIGDSRYNYCPSCGAKVRKAVKR